MSEKPLISIVIVNYNVAYFLEQCLLSVQKAAKKVAVEVFVVDNNSVDESVHMVTEKFPWVKLIANKHNLGFSKANNQAIKESVGKYVLLLNPDTVLAENTLEVCANFMDNTPKAGGLGVKMLDGKGRFLPESKRGLPTPKVAFHKIFGLSRLFPKSKRFSQYHLGHLSNEETHSIEVLSGAFMFMRKSVLDQVGLLDEDFFMYGEDIDLSYRIILGGHENYYLPTSQIIHYKGESTKKGSLNYVFIFYRAMVLFYKKHFSEQNARWFEFLINIAIYLRASASIAKRFFQNAILPLADVLLAAGAFYLIKQFYIDFSGVNLKENQVIYGAIGMLSLILIFGFFLSAYDKRQRLFKSLKTAFYTTLLTLIFYSLLPETIRFSRLVVLSWGASLALILPLSRLFVNLFYKGILKPQLKSKRILIISTEENYHKVQKHLEGSFEKKPSFYNLSPSAQEAFSAQYINDYVRINKIEEVIFSAEKLSSEQIMHLMMQIENRDLEFKIAPPESLYIIGSSSIHTQGDVYTIKANNIASTENIRTKRTLDICLSIASLVLLPIMLIVNHQIIKQALKVLFGGYTWIGFEANYRKTLSKPVIKKAIYPITILKLHTDKAKTFEWYSNNYNWVLDFKAFYSAVFNKKAIRK